MSMTIVYVLLYAMAGIMVLASVLPLLKVPHGAIKGLESVSYTHLTLPTTPYV